MSLLDKAKAVTGDAAQKASELREQAAELGSTSPTARPPSQEQAEEEGARDRRPRPRRRNLERHRRRRRGARARAALGDLNAALPLLKRAGY